MRMFSGLRHLKLIKKASEALLCSYPGTNDHFELPVDLPNVTVTICENDENDCMRVQRKLLSSTTLCISLGVVTMWQKVSMKYDQ